MTLPITAETLDHLQLVIEDLKLIKAAKAQAHRSQVTLKHIIPDPAEDAHHEGMQRGLDMAITTLAERIERAVETFGVENTPRAQAYAALKVAETEFALRAHGANAPMASAAYGSYVQAHNELERARADYARLPASASTSAQPSPQAEDAGTA